MMTVSCILETTLSLQLKWHSLLTSLIQSTVSVLHFSKTPPPSAEVKNVWSYTSTPQYVLMVWYLYFTFICRIKYNWNHILKNVFVIYIHMHKHGKTASIHIEKFP